MQSRSDEPSIVENTPDSDEEVMSRKGKLADWYCYYKNTVLVCL